MVELHTLVEDKDVSVSSVNQTMNAFELTVTQEFQGLKIRQTEIAVRMHSSTVVYNRLKDLHLNPKDLRSAECIGQMVEYDDDRHDCVSMIRAFYLASGEAINTHHQGDIRASMRRARSVVKLMEFWRAMFRATDFLQQDEDNDDEDNLWVDTPTPRNMSDLILEETLKGAKSEELGATAAAAEIMATTEMSMMDKIAHELRSRSVEVREYLTRKSKGRAKSRKKEETKEISPIRSSTPTPTHMTEGEREKEDKVMEKGSAGKKKKPGKKGKGGISPKDTSGGQTR